MGTTIGVSTATRDRLARLKRKLGAPSIYEALAILLDERGELEQRRRSDELLASVARHRKEIQSFCQAHHIRRLSIFGSALHGDARPDSDLDLLVEFEEQATLSYFDMSRIERGLEALLGMPVDLRTPQELSHHFRDEVIAEAQVVHAA